MQLFIIYHFHEWDDGSEDEIVIEFSYIPKSPQTSTDPEWPAEISVEDIIIQGEGLAPNRSVMKRVEDESDLDMIEHYCWEFIDQLKNRN